MKIIQFNVTQFCSEVLNFAKKVVAQFQKNIWCLISNTTPYNTIIVLTLMIVIITLVYSILFHSDTKLHCDTSLEIGFVIYNNDAMRMTNAEYQKWCTIEESK